MSSLANYQLEARTTAIYPAQVKVIYPALGLAGEAGEVCNKAKKILRDDAGNLTDDKRTQLVDELGDVLWYAANLATDLGVTLEEVAKRNLAKLKSRQERGTLTGSGDNR
jgi:NTP pyrophosphatase (non-canonical NTP hydrolase)